MNHNHVTHHCGRCDRLSVVILDGAHYCSSHALDMTLLRVGNPVVVDLRVPTGEAWDPVPQTLAS